MTDERDRVVELVILGSAALVYEVAWYAGSSPAFNEAPMRDRDIVELLVDFDHYGNTASEHFSMRMSVYDRHRTVNQGQHSFS
jgi:hypothetical protein